MKARVLRDLFTELLVQSFRLQELAPSPAGAAAAPPERQGPARLHWALEGVGRSGAESKGSHVVLRRYTT